MDVALRSLLDHVEGIASSVARKMGQFVRRCCDNLNASDEELASALMPTCGTRYYRFGAGSGSKVLRARPGRRVAARVIKIPGRHALQAWPVGGEPMGQRIIEDRGSQITFSALRQEAPPRHGGGWDQEGYSARCSAAPMCRAMCAAVARHRSTLRRVASTRPTAWSKLVEETKNSASEMLFISSDRLDPGGNDYPVKAAGYATRGVSGWESASRVTSATSLTP